MSEQERAEEGGEGLSRPMGHARRGASSSLGSGVLGQIGAYVGGLLIFGALLTLIRWLLGLI